MGRIERTEDNPYCPYCKSKQEYIYGTGAECRECENYYQIGYSVNGFISLYKKTDALKYRIKRDKFKSFCKEMDEFIGDSQGYYFNNSTKNKELRDIVVNYGKSIGMIPYQIYKYHKLRGSKLTTSTITKILNIGSNDKKE